MPEHAARTRRAACGLLPILAAITACGTPRALAVRAEVLGSLVRVPPLLPDAPEPGERAALEARQGEALRENHLEPPG